MIWFFGVILFTPIEFLYQQQNWKVEIYNGDYQSDCEFFIDVFVKNGVPAEAIIGEEHIPASNTTPESYVLQQYFRQMVDAGCKCVVMEVSSQGLMLHRVSGFTFDYGIFTNLSPDHIGGNEHKDFDDYLFCNVFGQQLVKSTCYHMLYEYNKKRGVETTGIHRYRHTFAKQWILNGGNVVSLETSRS